MTKDEFGKLISSDDYNIIKGKYTVDEQKLSAFKEAIELADKLSTEGKLNYKYFDPSVPMYVHCLNIRWLPQGEDEAVRIEGKRLAELVDKVDEFLTDNYRPLDWQLSSEIYSEA